MGSASPARVANRIAIRMTSPIAATVRRPHATLVVAFAAVACGGPSADTNGFAPLARAYVNAFNRHQWARVCGLGPPRPIAGFSGQAACAGRMARLFHGASMRYDGPVTSSFVGTVTTQITGPARFILVKLDGGSRELAIAAGPGRNSVFLYDDCARSLRRRPPGRVGGCP